MQETRISTVSGNTCSKLIILFGRVNVLCRNLYWDAEHAFLAEIVLFQFHEFRFEAKHEKFQQISIVMLR